MPPRLRREHSYPCTLQPCIQIPSMELSIPQVDAMHKKKKKKRRRSSPLSFAVVNTRVTGTQILYLAFKLDNSRARYGNGSRPSLPSLCVNVDEALLMFL